MNMDQLEYFMLVYRTRSVSEAAAMIPMSTQGLNKSIRSLEKELGVNLFAIDANGSRIPAQYAEALAIFAARIEKERQKLFEEYSRIDAERVRLVRLAACNGLPRFAGIDLVHDFKESHPDIEVQMREMSDPSCDEAIKHGMADIALTLLPFDPGLVTTTLYSEGVYLWVNTSNPLAARDSLTFEDLAGEKLSTSGEGIKLHTRLMDELRKRNIKIAGSVESPEMFRHYQDALSNGMIGLTVENLAKDELFCQSPEVRAIRLEGMQWTIGISHLHGRVLAPHNQEFLDFAIRWFKKHRPSPQQSRA